MKLSRGSVVGPGGRVGQFWTPRPTAEHFVRWLGVRPGMRVIDVGAGMGALSYAALDRGARVMAVEVDPALVERIRTPLERSGAVVVHQDVLAPMDRRQVTFDAAGYSHDVALSNPPWEEDLPERFLERMLTLAPRAGAIVPSSFMFGVERAKFWRHVSVRRLKHLMRRPNFGGPWSGGKRDVVFLEITGRGVARQRDEADVASIEVGE